MGRLRDRINEQYLIHYARVNKDVCNVNVSHDDLKKMQLKYGDFVSSLPETSKVLDLGCGVGFFLKWLEQLPGIIPFGVDSSPSQVEMAQKNLPKVEVFCEDGLSYLKRNQETFSGIFCMDVLEHIQDEEICLELVEEARNALKKSGFFFCRVPNAASLIGNHSRYMDITHERIFTSTSIIQLLEIAGFEECRIVPFRPFGKKDRIRFKIEMLLHKFIFQICYRKWENVFTKNICAIGYNK